MSTFGWTQDYVRKRLPGAQGWVYFNWALENEQTVLGPRWRRTGPGPVRQEYLALMARWSGRGA